MLANRFSIVLLGLLVLLPGNTSGQSSNASCRIGPKDLPKLLRSIEPLIEKGFGNPEIQVIQRLADSTLVKHYGRRDFSITYRGKAAALRVEVNKNDVDQLEIWFITEPQLATEIQGKIRERFH